jgi:hypothetical protein
MSRASSRAAFIRDARNSRRAALRWREIAQEPRLTWRRPLRRVQRALDSSFRLIDSSRRVIDASERFAAGSSLRTAARQLQRVSEWIDDASEQLGRAVRGLRQTTDSVARAPEQGAAAPALLIETARRWVDAAATLAALSDRLEETFARLRAAAERGILIVDRPESAPQSQPRFTAPRPASRRSCAGDRLTTSSIRRPWPAPASRAVDAARRISRGRAPPFGSTCPLSSAS